MITSGRRPHNSIKVKTPAQAELGQGTLETQESIRYVMLDSLSFGEIRIRIS